MKRIVIIGGGIAGLSAAYRIQEAMDSGQSQLECTVLESTDRFGGKICTELRDGFLLEKGPDSFISQKPWAIEHCKKIGLADHLIGTRPENTKTYVYLNKKMVTLPDGLSLMVPTKFLPFITTRLFSWPGKIRMGLDLIIPKRRKKTDESLASFVRRRLGEEAVQRLAQPMLAGIYASDPEEMSLHSTFPMFAQIEKKYRSLILGMLIQKKQRAAAPPKKSNYTPFTLFVSLKNGLSEIVDRTIKKSPNINFKKNVCVKQIQQREGKWHLTLDSGDILIADSVIVSTPANISSKLLQDTAPLLANGLSDIKYVSTAAVVMGFRKEEMGHPLNGFGFIVPSTEKRKITACTWVSSKFAGRVPEGHVLLRSFVGGALQEDLAEQNEDTIKDMVLKELKDIMGISGNPLFCDVFQYKKGNAQYMVGHQKLVGSIYQELEKFPGLYLSGSAYEGTGVPDCILNGTKVAEKVLDYINSI